ncbi:MULTISPECIES: anacyclamide/piricyclamide family prenylated cyclic peptide [unclassified Microcoleus]
MKKKSLRPQIVAPVQRETTATTTTSTGVGLVAFLHSWDPFHPFAGEDAE